MRLCFSTRGNEGIAATPRPNFDAGAVWVCLAGLWSFGFWILGVAVPIGSILAEGGEYLKWGQLFDPVVMAVLAATLKQVFWSTFFAGGLGLILGLMLGQVARASQSSRFLFVFSLPMVVPTVVAGLGWLIWMGRSGLLTRLGVHFDWAYRFEAVILAHAFYNIPWVTLGVAQARRSVPEDQLDALSTLGADRWSVWQYGIWPQVRWAWGTACAQVMGFCTVSFALVLVLGGGPPVQTLETEVFSRLRSGGVDWSGALACALWEFVLTLVPWFLVLFFQTREQIQLSQKAVAREPQGDARVSVGGSWVILCLGLFFLLPYFGVYAVSWGALPKLLQSSEIARAFQFSFSLAIWTSTLTILTTLAALIFLFHSKISAQTRGILGFLFALPSGVSVIVLGLGVGIAYGRWIDPFEGSPAAMILLQMTLFSPLSMRTLWPVASCPDLRSIEVAGSLGASPFSAWWVVEWPRWRGPLIVAWGTVFGAVLGEVGAVSLFASEKWVTLPGLISQSMLHYRFDDAQVLAGLLLENCCPARSFDAQS